MEDAQSQIEAIEIEIEAAKEKIALRDAMLRLEKNRDFKKVFADFFLRDYAVRLVKLRVHPAFQSEEHQKGTNDYLLAIGKVNEFINSVIVEGNELIPEVEKYEAEIDSIRAEDEQEV